MLSSAPHRVDPIDAFIEAVLGDSAGNTAPVWRPFPDSPQERAYHSTADIIGYGGAAGGGKTDLALGKAFQQFYRSIVFRREYTQLRGVIERGDIIQDGQCRYIAGEKKHWKTPDGRTIELGSVEHESDKVKYKGRPHDFIVFDEAADFPESVMRFITGWLRTERADVHPQVLLCFNPPTSAEGEWIIRYFAPWIDPNYAGERAKPGELRWFITVDDKDVEVETDGAAVSYEGASYTPKSRTFYPARVEDNPVYMATGYDKQLESLPEPLRSQLRWGDFAVTIKDDLWQAIPTAWVIEAQNRWLQTQKPDVSLRAVGVDPSRGGADETAISKLYGVWFAPIISHPGENVPDGIVGAKRVLDAMGDENALIAIDVVGIGASVYDQLKVLSGVRVRAVNVGEAPNTHDKTGRYQFANLRAQIVWQFREALDPASGENIALPPDSQLRVDLCAARYSVVGGKIKIETKDDIKNRIKRSPDRGEAILLCWYGANNRPGGAVTIDWW